MEKPIGISLGWNCSPAMYAVSNGMREIKQNGYQTCPFDEMISNLPGIIECLEEDFKHFTDENYLKVIESPISVGGIVKGEKLLYNTKYNFIFNHESPGHANLYITQRWHGGINHYVDNGFRLFKERYDRRINSFREYLKQGENDSVINFIVFRFNKDVSKLKDVLDRKYPNLNYNIHVQDPPESNDSVYGHHVLMGLNDNVARVEIQM